MTEVGYRLTKKDQFRSFNIDIRFFERDAAFGFNPDEAAADIFFDFAKLTCCFDAFDREIMGLAVTRDFCRVLAD